MDFSYESGEILAPPAMTQPQFDAGNFPYWSTNLLERELPIHGIAIQSSRTCSQPAFWRWSIKLLLHMDLQWYGSIRLSLRPKIAGHIHFVPGHSLSPHGCEDIFRYHRFLLFNDMIWVFSFIMRPSPPRLVLQPFRGRWLAREGVNGWSMVWDKIGWLMMADSLSMEYEWNINGSMTGILMEINH